MAAYHRCGLWNKDGTPKVNEKGEREYSPTVKMERGEVCELCNTVIG